MSWSVQVVGPKAAAAGWAAAANPIAFGCGPRITRRRCHPTHTIIIIATYADPCSRPHAHSDTNTGVQSHQRRQQEQQESKQPAAREIRREAVLLAATGRASATTPRDGAAAVPLHPLVMEGACVHAQCCGCVTRLSIEMYRGCVCVCVARTDQHRPPYRSTDTGSQPITSPTHPPTH